MATEVNYSTQVILSFPAGHHLHDPAGPCGDRPHGHHYRVIVTLSREGYAQTDLDEYARAREVVLSLVKELRNRSLNDMLGAQEPNVYGLASFFMERLAINVPVIGVEVHEDDTGPRAVIRTDD